MADLIIENKNETYIHLIAEQSILQELQECFTFYAEGYKYHPKYKQKLWDGKIRILRLLTKTKGEIYYGLLFEILKFCKNREYTVKLSEELKYDPPDKNELQSFLNKINIASKGEKLILRDYQEKGIIDAIQNKRQLIKSPTSSGKSAVIYSIIRYLNNKNLKGLILVPNISLIHQLYNDFIDYSSINNWDTEKFVHKIYSGQDKMSNKNIYLSTWQSLQNIKQQSFFESFDYIICDEVHQAKGAEITKIFEKCINASYRIGLTGTTDNIKANINTIIGLTGPINSLITTKELMDRKEVSSFSIRCLILKYDKEVSKAVKKFKYQDEIKFIVSNNKRNNFIKNLALSLNKNSIILCNFVETHGKVIYELLLNSKNLNDRKVYFIHGGVDGEERERVRQIMETETNAIIVASSAIMSTGVSIKNLHNIIFAISGKSRIRTLQSIGRVLRLHHSKDKAILYDIVDDLSISKHKNFTLNHFLERVKMYNQEQFDYVLKTIEFN
jgi:superfamily II DNA or RNA helicase